MDIIPEVLELLEDDKKIFMYVFIAIGIIILKLIDILVPHHNHDEELKTHHRHLKHIGIISSLSLIMHNVIEGASIFNLASHDIKAGILMAIGVGLHNIPFGIEITATLYETKKERKKIIFNILLLTISTVLGALVMMIFKDINSFVLGGLMSITIGMIVYLILFELLGEFRESKNKKHSLIGLFSGIIFMVIILLIGG